MTYGENLYINNRYFPYDDNYKVTGLWEFTQAPIFPGSGSGFNPATAYKTGSTDGPITGAWQHVGEFNVNAGSGNVTLQSVTGAVNLSAPNAGQFINANAANIALVGSAAVTVTGGSLTVNMSGNASIGATGPLSLSGSSVAIVPASVANVVTANALYYNSSNGLVTYGTAGGSSFNPATPQTITGAWSMNGGFSVTSASGNIPIVATSGNISLAASSGNVTLNSPSVLLPALTNVVTANVVYFNTTSGLLTYGSFTSFSTSANYTLTGSWQFNSGFNVTAATGDVTIQSTTGSLNLLAPAATKSVNIQAPNLALTSTTLTLLSGPNISVTSTGPIALQATGALSLQGGSITAPGLASAVTGSVLYFNSGSGAITQGAAPSGGMSWNNVTGTSQAIAAKNAYVANNAAVVAFSLPASAAFGDEFKVVGLGAGGWTIACNAGQTLSLGSASSASGGSAASTHAKDCLSFVCVVANTTFECYSAVGNVNFI